MLVLQNEVCGFQKNYHEVEQYSFMLLLEREALCSLADRTHEVEAGISLQHPQHGRSCVIPERYVGS